MNGKDVKMIVKKKICKTCGTEQYIWARGNCKACDSKGKTSSLKKTKLKVYKPPTVEYKGKSMPVHTAIYMSAFGYDINDTYFPSEIDGAPSVDINHIINRSRAGKDADNILNLMAVTREQHEDYGDREDFIDGMIQTHLSFCESKGLDVPALIRSLPESLARIKLVYEENTVQ